jgi:S-layer protein (TIGR01567 family)
MKFKFSKMIAVAVAGLMLLTLLSPSAFAVAITRTISYDTSETSSSGLVWDATTFEGFYYSVNKNVNYLNDGWGERLYFQEDADSDNGPLGDDEDPDNNIIDDGELIYSITPYPSTYKLVSELGLDADEVPADVGGTCYYEIPWFGVPYVAVDGDSTQLARLVYKQGGSDKQTLKTGESWDLGSGYSLECKQVDIEGDKVLFSLSKDGEELESEILEVDGTVGGQTFAANADFGDGDDQLYFMTYVEQVFQGSVDSLAVFRYTWLIDKDDVLLISSDDVYQGFNVDVAAEDGLVLSNDDSITIDVEDDQKTYFTDSWYFQPSDEDKGAGGNGYILYPAVDRSQPGTYTVRGIPVDTGLTSSLDWNPATFRGFYYSVNKNVNYLNDGWGERLYFQDEEGSDNGPLGDEADPDNNIIDDGELIYAITPYTSTYKLVSELGLDADEVPADVGGTCYYETPWFSVPYVAVEGDATQLAKLVYKQGGSDKKNVKAGESWDLGCGYSLEVNQVDVEGNKVWFSLCKDGEELEDGIIDVDGTVESQTFVARADFGDDSDQLYFMTYVEQVFQGSVDSLAVFRYTWLIDTEDVLLISSDDVYQGFNVDVAAEDRLELSNDDSITIDVEDDQKTYFTDSWYFQASDEDKGTGGNGYILYPACDITVEAPEDEAESEEVGESNETEVIEPAEDESAEDETGDEQVKAGSEEEGESEGSEPGSEEKSPGFGLLTAVFGISAVGFLVRRK